MHGRNQNSPTLSILALTYSSPPLCVLTRQKGRKEEPAIKPALCRKVIPPHCWDLKGSGDATLCVLPLHQKGATPINRDGIFRQPTILASVFSKK